MEYADYIGRLSATHPELAAQLAPFRGLGGVFDWMKQRGFALGDAEIIHQDEFSLDFVLPLGAGGEHLALGIT